MCGVAKVSFLLLVLWSEVRVIHQRDFVLTFFNVLSGVPTRQQECESNLSGGNTRQDENPNLALEGVKNS